MACELKLAGFFMQVEISLPFSFYLSPFSFLERFFDIPGIMSIQINYQSYIWLSVIR